MISSTISRLSVLALALASPALSCVQYSCNLNFDNGNFNAALTDNGGQVCQLTNYYFGIVTANHHVIELSCNGGARASFDFDNGGVVSYSHGSFSGSFGTITEQYSDNRGTYWTANVWGC